MTQSLNLTFHNATGHYLLGLAYYRSGDWETAEQCFQLALKVSPLYPAGWLMLSRISKQHRNDAGAYLAFKGKAEEAREKLKEMRVKQQLEVAPESDAEDTRTPLPELTGETEMLTDVPEAEIITVISGLPRSGTSLMMQMLEAVGIQIYQDGKRQADESNLKGYYEHERVTHLMRAQPTEKAWVSEAKGRGLKVVAPLLSSLPLYDQSQKVEKGEVRKGLHYRVIYMERAMEEILSSQSTMLTRLEKDPIKGNPEKGYRQQVRASKTWLKARNISALSVDFRKLCEGDEEEFRKLAAFLNKDDQLTTLKNQVDAALYRERKERT